MRNLLKTVLILSFVVFASCATKPKQLPHHQDQEKLSQSFEKNPEGFSSYQTYLEAKTGIKGSKVCVENSHDDLGYWSVYSKSNLSKPLAITMQDDDHRFNCVSVSSEAKDLVLKAEVFGKDGKYNCTVDVKVNELIQIDDDHGHPLACGNVKGVRN